jgi:BirA family transcriptional regulator, biotin operon repressor / biotin---[acetyl-CoA-carboxylase] ligase
LADPLAPDVVEPLLAGRFGRPYLYRERCEDVESVLDPSLGEGATAVCDEQTAGAWEAPLGTAIVCAILLRPPAERRAAELSLVGAVATAETVEEALGLSAQIKWPNDVMVDRYKLARIHVESRDSAAVLGIALNVNQRRFELPEALPVPAASLLTIDAHRRERAPLLTNLLLRLERAYDEWSHGDPNALSIGVGPRDFLRGRRVSIDGQTGIAVGIDRAGRLEIDIGGARRVAESGRVTYVR